MKPTWRSEYIILALLGEQPMHGYELHQRIRSDESLWSIWRIERSQLYFLLRKLQRDGYIAEMAEERAGGPARLIYSPTASGRAALGRWLHTPEHQPHDLRAAFLAKLYLVLRSQPEAAPQLIEAQRQVLSERAVRQRERAGGDGFVAQVHRLRLSQIEAALKWLEELAQMAQNGAWLATVRQAELDSPSRRL